MEDREDGPLLAGEADADVRDPRVIERWVTVYSELVRHKERLLPVTSMWAAAAVSPRLSVRSPGFSITGCWVIASPSTGAAWSTGSSPPRPATAPGGSAASPDRAVHPPTIAWCGFHNVLTRRRDLLPHSPQRRAGRLHAAVRPALRRRGGCATALRPQRGAVAARWPPHRHRRPRTVRVRAARPPHHDGGDAHRLHLGAEARRSTAARSRGQDRRRGRV